MRDIGTAGESFFAAWCASAGITANKSVSDSNGWDAFIEIDTVVDLDNAQELHEPLVECKIQIKSTDGRKRGVDIPLSNLKKMVTTPLPAFYLLLEFDSSEAPATAFLMHVDESMCRKVLKRIRELISKDKTVKLNKKTMRLNFEDSMKILPLNAAKLKEAILSTVGQSASSYISKKQSHLANTGFEDGVAHMRFSIDNEADLEKFIDMSLGRGGSVPITNVISSSIRFGIPNSNHLVKSSSAIVELGNIVPYDSGTLVILNPENGATVSYDVDVFRSVLSDWVPESKRKLRIDAGLLEIELGYDGVSIKVRIRLFDDTEADIVDILKIFKTCSILSKPYNVEILLKFQRFKLPLKLNDGEGFSKSTYQIELLERLMKIKYFFEHHDKLITTCFEINKLSQSILIINHLIGTGSHKTEFKFTLDKELESSVNVHSLLCTELTIGGYLYLGVFAVIGELKNLEHGHYEFIGNEIKTLYKTVVTVEDADNEFVEKKIKDIIRSYNTDSLCIDLSSTFRAALKIKSPIP